MTKNSRRNIIKNRFNIKLIGLLGSLMLLLAAFIAPAFAFDGRTGQEVVIAADDVIKDDLYVSAETFILDGTVDGDLFVVGKDIIINGTITGDLWAAGQAVSLNGVVEDDARLAGAVLQFSSTARVGDDAFVAGNSFEAKRESAIGGSLFFGGAQAWLGGTVQENLNAGGYGLNLQGQVEGDVNASVGGPQQGFYLNPVQFMPELPAIPKVSGGLTLSPAATIGGNLNYMAAEAGDIPAGVVAGKVAFTPGPAFETSIDMSPGVIAQRLFVAWLFDNTGRLIALVIVGALLAWFAPDWIIRPAESLQNRPWPSLGWGALTLVLFPLAILVLIGVMVLLALLLGLLTFGKLGSAVGWLGLVTVLAVLVAFGLLVTYFAQIVVGYWGGRLMLARLKPAWAENPIWPVLVGVVILALLTAIPVIGWFLNFFIILFGLGTLWVMWRSQKTASSEPAPALA